jgi:SAM-dependent methyltransferase
MQDFIPDSAYWNRELKPLWQKRKQGLWRYYCDELYRQLLAEWLGEPREPLRRSLKTDLFDEVMGPGLVGALAARGGAVHAVDVSAEVVRQAALVHAQGRFLMADVRRLPYADGAFCLVLSNSTLDHFPEHADIVKAIRELRRILRPGGALLVTFDNMSNPWLALRNALPFAWLHRMGVVPYYVGASVTAAGLWTLLEEAGFRIERKGTLVHVPRILAVPLSGWMEHSFPRLAGRWLDAMFACEHLRGWATQWWTGHYVAALARVPDDGGGKGL